MLPNANSRTAPQKAGANKHINGRFWRDKSNAMICRSDNLQANHYSAQTNLHERHHIIRKNREKRLLAEPEAPPPPGLALLRPPNFTTAVWADRKFSPILPSSLRRRAVNQSECRENFSRNSVIDFSSPPRVGDDSVKANRKKYRSRKLSLAPFFFFYQHKGNSWPKDCATSAAAAARGPEMHAQSAALAVSLSDAVRRGPQPYGYFLISIGFVHFFEQGVTRLA